MADIDISTLYMIDDSDDESYMTRLYFDRQQVSLSLQHFFSFEEFMSAAESGRSFEPMTSIVVVDLNLRSIRGTEVIAQIRHKPWGSDAVVGVCSGSEDPADRQSAVEVGADFFVGKPLDRTMVGRICELDGRLEASHEADQPMTVKRITT